MAYKDLTFLLFAKDMSASRGFEKVAASADGMAKGISGSMGMAAVAVAGTAIALGAKSVEMAAAFESATTRLVTDAGTSASQLGMVRKGILGISDATGTTATDVAAGMYTISSAGFTGAKGLDVLHAAAEGAKVGYADLHTVSDALTTVLTDFAGKHAPTAMEAMNGLIATVSHGKTTMEDLAGSLHNVLPGANLAGLGLNQVLGAMATMTGEGISAAQASENLNNAISSLTAPSQVAKDAMAGVGLSSLDVAKNLGKRGLTGTYELLTHAIATHTKGGLVALNLYNTSAQAASSFKAEIAGLPAPLRSTAEAFEAGHVTAKQWSGLMKQQPATVANLGKQFATTVKHAEGFSSAVKNGDGPARTFNSQLEKMTGGMTGMSVAAHLTGDHMGTFKSNVTGIGDALKKNGKHVTDWGTYQKTLNAQLDKAKVSFGNAGIQIGMALMPALKAILPEIPKIAHDIQNMAPGIADFAKWLVGVFDNFRDGAKQWGQIFAAVGKWWNDTVKAFGQGADQLNGFFGGIEKAFSDGANQLNRFFKDVEGWVRDTVKNFGDGWNQIIAGVKGAWQGITGAFNDGRKQLNAFFDGAGKWLVDAGRNIIDGLVNGIKGAVGFVTDTVKNIAGGVIGTFKNVLGIHSPSKVFHDFGMNIGQGLTNGLLGTKTQVGSASNTLANTVIGMFEQKKGGIGKATESAALAALTSGTKQLEKIAADRAIVATKLKAAQTTLKDVLTARKDYASGIKSSTVAAGDVTTLGSAGDMVQHMSDLVAHTKQFRSILKRLVSKGIDQTTYGELVQAGVDGGGLTAAQSLLANPLDLKEVVSLQRQLSSAAGSLGTDAANHHYKSAVATDRGRVTDLKRLDTAYSREQRHVAASTVKRVAGDVNVHINLSGHLYGSQTELAKAVVTAIRAATRSGAISKDALKV